MGAVIPDKDPSVRVWLSPTQIDLVELCERKYFFDRVLKMRAPTTGSQQLGIDVENHIEAALTHGKEPPKDPAGAIATEMLILLPKRGTQGLVFQSEFRRKLPLSTGGFFGITGKKDLRLPGRKVWDFKTTKDPKKYMKGAPELIADIQCETYAWDEMLFALENKISAPDSMDMEWVYGKTKGAPRAYSSPVTFPWAKAMQGPERAHRAALRILDLKQPGVKAEDTKFNTGACDAFGGCSHRAYCPARAKNLSQLFGFEPEEKKMGIKDKLLASLGAAPAGAVAPAQPAPQTPPAAPPATAVPAQAVPSTVTPAALGANGKPILVVGELACGACQGTAWNFKGGPCLACKATGYEGGVEPEVVDTKPQTPAPSSEVSAPPAEGVNPPDAALSPDDAPPAAATEEKPKRTRRTKAQIEADNAQAAQTVATKTAELVEMIKPSAPVSTDFRLFIDCLPIKGNVTLSADGLVQLALKLAAEKAGVADYRLVEYGKGPAYVVMALAELTNGGELFGDYTINSRLPENQAVLGWLMDRAQSVIKGVL